MSNYYQCYYNSKCHLQEGPGKTVKLVGFLEARSSKHITDAQKEFHTDLLNFLEEKGVLQYGRKGLDRPRNRNDCRSKINALLTILKKEGLAEEFFGKNKEEEK